jgi:hypothetical protein
LRARGWTHSLCLWHGQKNNTPCSEQDQNMGEGDEVGAKASMATLQAFNLCILHLGRLARDRGASRFITDGLQAFSQLVPFASAWWGEMSAPGVVYRRVAHLCAQRQILR